MFHFLLTAAFLLYPTAAITELQVSYPTFYSVSSKPSHLEYALADYFSQEARLEGPFLKCLSARLSSLNWVHIYFASF
jgi:hypothetical protein